MDCESDSEEEVFWDSLSSIEEEIETLKEVNRDMSETIMDTKANGTECKFDDELFEEVWGNIHMNKAIENELNLSRNTEDTEEIEKEEAGIETTETEAKKTSLGKKSKQIKYHQISKKTTKEDRTRKIVYSKFNFIFCYCW